MNYYNRFIGAIQRKTAHLSPAAMGCYDRLLDWYYSQERPIPLEPEDTWRICGAVTASDQAAVASVLKEFFEQTAEGWTQGRATEEIPKAQARIKAARANGAKGGRPPNNPEKTQRVPKQKPTGQPSAKAPHTTVSSSSKKTPQPPKGEAGGGFQRFWNAYPSCTKKAARLQCWTKWKDKELEPLADQIVAHVEAMKKNEQWQRDGGRYIPAPLVYLNQARYEAPTGPADDASTSAAHKAHEETQRLLREQQEHGRRVEAERLARIAARKKQGEPA